MNPVARRHRTPSADVESALLNAASQLLAAEGPGALSVRRIAEAAGVSTMGVYSRFGGKHGIVEALWRQGFEDFSALLHASTGTDALDRLVVGARRYREFALAHPTTYGIMFQQAVPEFVPSTDAVEFSQASFATFVGYVADAIDDGYLAEADPTEVAQSIWATLHGLVALELVGMGFVEDKARHFDGTVSALLAGFGPDAAMPASR